MTPLKILNPTTPPISSPTTMSMIVMRFFIAAPFESLLFVTRGRRARLVLLALRRRGGPVFAPPPAATERLEQGRRIGVAGALSCRERKPRQLVLLLGDQQRQRTGPAKLILVLR